MRHLLTLCFLITCIPVHAQEKQKNRTCRILFLERPSEAPTEAYLFDGEQSHKVSLPSMNLSEVIELPMGEITIGMTSDKVDTPEAFPAGAPTVKIPEEDTDVYLLLFSDPENKTLPLRIQSIPIDSGKLEPGQTLWFNFSKNKIAAKLGSEEVMIEPLKRTISKPPRKNSGYYKVHLLYQPDGTEDFYPMMRKSWWHDATSRNLGFVIGTSARLPRIFTFRDHRVEEGRKKPD